MSAGSIKPQLDGDPLPLLASLSQTIGAPEAALRLLISIIAGYPIAAIYRLLIVKNTSKDFHHVFFVSCGLGLYYFNYGIDAYHSLIATTFTYILCMLQLSANKFLAINFIFHMTYLLTGYYCTESNEYDILWTMPHCVLTLRMIGFGFDITDGQKPQDQLSKDQLETALSVKPNYLELLAFAYFPSGFLVGPQFPYRRYKRFIDGEFDEYTGSVSVGIKRLLVGIIYLAIRQVGASFVPDEYFLTPEYANETLVRRLLFLGIWGKISLYKYISCWLMTEGALMCIGFTYNGTDQQGNANWYGCSNVKLILLESGNTMGHYVQSFNVNTNQWVSSYVYKRLKFLNNRTISYAAALGFLAVWHGFHSGYYMSFLIEYMIVTIEKDIQNFYNEAVLAKYGNTLRNSYIYLSLEFITLKLYNLIYMGWCLTPFIFLSYSRWIHVFRQIYFFGFVYVGIWIIILRLYKMKKRAGRRERNPRSTTNATTAPETSIKED